MYVAFLHRAEKGAVPKARPICGLVIFFLHVHHCTTYLCVGQS